LDDLTTFLRVIRPFALCPNRRREAEQEAVRQLIDEIASGSKLSYLPNGAPYIEGCSCNISISHTRGFVALVAYPKPHPAGIDIEYRSERALRVGRRFLSPEEYAALDGIHIADHALLYWCAKETLYKLLGTPVSDYRSELCIAPFSFGTSGTIRAKAAGKSFLLEFELTPEYACVWNNEENSAIVF
jgi:phosphopantetheinyl transferase